MRLVTQGIIYIICLNAAVYMLNSAEVPWMTGFNTTGGDLGSPEDVIAKWDVNATQRGWTGQAVENFFGYISNGVNIFFSLFTSTIYAFPEFLRELGTPTWVWLPFDMIWSALLIIFFVELITGRQILD